MNSREVFPLFATPLTVTNNYLPDKYLEPLIKYYKEGTDIWRDTGHPYQSMQTKSKKTLDNFPDVKWYMEKDFNMFIKDLLWLKPENKFAMGTSWGTKTTPETVSHFHTHTNYFYSGVYYFEETDTPIEFQRPLQGWQFGFEKEDFNLWNNDVFQIKPKANTMVYFPSCVEHRITYHQGKEDRYSIAMNFMPVGVWGNLDSRVSMEMTDGIE